MAIAKKDKIVEEHQENISNFYNRLVSACKNQTGDDGSGQSLSKLAAQLEANPLTFDGAKIKAADINKILKSLEMIKQGTNNPINIEATETTSAQYANVQKIRISTEIINDIEANITKLESSSLTCGAACQGICTSGCSGCTASCGTSCSGECGGKCENACGSGCSGRCSSGCSTCSSGCQKAAVSSVNDCSGGCSQTCNSSCAGCDGDCSSGCSGSCSSVCMGGCSGCSSGCSGQCSGTCGGECSSSCSSSCKETCQSGAGFVG